MRSLKRSKSRINILSIFQGFHSIVLMGVADADYKFIFYDVGAYGSEGDNTIFNETAFGRKLMRNELALPPPATINGSLLPFFFISDDAFTLSTRMIKPYCPKDRRTLTKEENVFNYR